MSDLMTLSGKVGIPEELAQGLKLGDQVAVIVRGTVRAHEEVQTASRGTDLVTKLRLDSAIVVEDEKEANAMLEKLAEAKAAADEERTGQQRLKPEDAELAAAGDEALGETGPALDDDPVEIVDYRTMNIQTLRNILEARDLSTAGAKADLVQRLIDNDAAETSG